MSLVPVNGIRMTPAGHLRWVSTGDDAARAEPAPLSGEKRARSIRTAFEADWREALFTLAAEKAPVQDLPGVRYWQQLAERYLTGLCRVPEDAESFEAAGDRWCGRSDWSCRQGGEHGRGGLPHPWLTQV